MVYIIVLLFLLHDFIFDKTSLIFRKVGSNLVSNIFMAWIIIIIEEIQIKKEWKCDGEQKQKKNEKNKELII